MSVMLLAAVSGCVRRRFTVRSNPPGAVVYVDDQQIGTTPVSTDFTYYGTRKFRLVKDGFETLTALQTFAPPWYEIPPLDFVSENLIGRELRDERVVEFQLEPQRIVPQQELLGRANNLRTSARQGLITPLPPAALGPATVPPPTTPPTGLIQSNRAEAELPPPFYP